MWCHDFDINGFKVYFITIKTIAQNPAMKR